MLRMYGVSKIMETCRRNNLDIVYFNYLLILVTNNLSNQQFYSVSFLKPRLHKLYTLKLLIIF